MIALRAGRGLVALAAGLVVAAVLVVAAALAAARPAAASGPAAPINAAPINAALINGAPAVLATGLTGVPGGPTLTVSKTIGLQDEEWVTVSGAGFTPNQRNLSVGQCPTVAAALDTCNVQLGMQVVTADATGQFGPVPVRVLVSFGAVNCRTSVCVIRALAPDAMATRPFGMAAVDLSFADPAVTTTPPATSQPAAGSPTAAASGVAAGPGGGDVAGSTSGNRTRIVWIGGLALVGLLAFAAALNAFRRRATVS